jgi:hypothetical protein
MDISNVTSEQLRKAADLKDNIDALQAELNALLGGEVPAPAQVAIEASQALGNGGRKRRKKVSAEGRANISAAQKARWAARRAETQFGAAPAVEAEKPKRRISPALRKARSEALKARWAERKAAGRGSL